MTEERFLTLAVVQQELSLTQEQVVTLITSGELPAVQLLGLWRVERSALEQFIRRLYISTAQDLSRTSDKAPPSRAGDVRRPEDAAPSAGRDHRDRHADLTPQMRRVLDLVAAGRSNSEIAEELTVEVSTVKSHVSRLLSRLGCRDRENLIAFAWRSGLVHAEDADPPAWIG